MVHCNKVGGGKRKMKGGSSNMAGSAYQGESPAVQEGTPYVGFNLKGNTSGFFRRSAKYLHGKFSRPPFKITSPILNFLPTR